MSEKVIFLDRDGVINEMVFIKEHGYVDSPNQVKQFHLIRKVGLALKIVKQLGFKIIIISNQPGIAKGYFSEHDFEKIRNKMIKELAKYNVKIDDEYYCLHHPDAKISKYKKICNCRKPKDGLIKQARKKYDIDLKKSYFIGDGIIDMQIAKKVGCKAIFVGNINSLITDLFVKKEINPNYTAKNLFEAIKLIKKDMN